MKFMNGWFLYVVSATDANGRQIVLLETQTVKFAIVKI